MNLDMIKKYFPHAFRVNDVKSLIVNLVIYALIAFVAGIVLGLLGIIPILGFVFGVIGWVVELYCTAGVILAILVFLKVIK